MSNGTYHLFLAVLWNAQFSHVLAVLGWMDVDEEEERKENDKLIYIFSEQSYFSFPVKEAPVSALLLKFLTLPHARRWG